MLVCWRPKGLALQKLASPTSNSFADSHRALLRSCREGFTAFCQVFGGCRPAQLRDHVLCSAKGMCLEDAVKGFAADNDPRCSLSCSLGACDSDLERGATKPTSTPQMEQPPATMLALVAALHACSHPSLAGAYVIDDRYGRAPDMKWYAHPLTAILQYDISTGSFCRGSSRLDMPGVHVVSATAGPPAEDVERLSVRRRRSSSKSAVSPLQFSEPAMSYLRRLAQAAARDAARSPEEETLEEVEVTWLPCCRSSRLSLVQCHWG